MASTCPRPPQKGPPRSGLAATGRGRGEQKGRERKKQREMDNGGEQEIEGTCNKREQKEARGNRGADKEKTGGSKEERWANTENKYKNGRKIGTCGRRKRTRRGMGSLVKWRKIETVHERENEEKCVQTFHLKG